MNRLLRRIGSYIAYEFNKNKIFHFKYEDSELYRKVLMTRLAMDLRKWQTYSRVVTKKDKLTEEQLLKQNEQKAILEKGEVQISDADLIKDPQPYQVIETYWVENEREGWAYKVFLLMFKDEYTESRTNKWKIRLRKLFTELTNEEEVVEKLIKDIDVNLTFWKAVIENPYYQIDNEQLKDNPRFLEFTWKALQRVLEIGQISNEKLRDTVAKTQLNDSLISQLEEYIKSSKNNLSNDLVQRRQNRFELIEQKIKEIQSTTPSVEISMIDLNKLLNSILAVLVGSEQFVKIENSYDQLNYYAQVSQFLFVIVMVNILTLRKLFEYK